MAAPDAAATDPVRMRLSSARMVPGPVTARTGPKFMTCVLTRRERANYSSEGAAAWLFAEGSLRRGLLCLGLAPPEIVRIRVAANFLAQLIRALTLGGIVDRAAPGG